MTLTFNQLEKEDITLLVLQGKLIFEEECDAFNQQIKALLAANKNKIILNLEEVSYCDSVGLDSLVKALVSAENRNGDVKLLKPSQKVQDLLDLTRLSTVFDIHTSEEEALASFK